MFEEQKFLTNKKRFGNLPLFDLYIQEILILHVIEFFQENNILRWSLVFEFFLSFNNDGGGLFENYKGCVIE